MAKSFSIKGLTSPIINNNSEETNIELQSKLILECNEDRDIISMNLFWIEINGKRKNVYPLDKLDNIIFYIDSKNIIRGFEKETIKYMKTYNLINHPISNEPIPLYVLSQVNIIDIKEIQATKTLENIALDVFQYFSKISIFIDYNLFLDLDKTQLIKFNYELKDFWLQNFSDEQRNKINNSEILMKTEHNLKDDSLEDIQRYLLSQMEILLKCDIEEYKYMINYILVGALGIVIHQIKEMYPDFIFSF
jgi:hypothetical protein